jgi:organic hydroperoxide reductase OsmC/OhrA
LEPTKRAYKSFHYKAKTAWSSGRRGMLSAAGRPNIVVGSPPEFKGEPDIWAPEELLVGSLNTCMMLTFLTLAQAQGLTPVGYESEAEACSRTSRGSTTSPKSRSDPASPSRARPNSSLPAKAWKASKPTASSQIRLTPGSRSRRSLSLLPHQSENVPHQLNAQSSGKRFEPIRRKHVGAHWASHRRTIRDEGGTVPYVDCCGARVRLWQILLQKFVEGCREQ